MKCPLPASLVRPLSHLPPGFVKSLFPISKCTATSLVGEKRVPPSATLGQPGRMAQAVKFRSLQGFQCNSILHPGVLPQGILLATPLHRWSPMKSNSYIHLCLSLGFLAPVSTSLHVLAWCTAWSWAPFSLGRGEAGKTRDLWWYKASEGEGTQVPCPAPRTRFAPLECSSVRWGRCSASRCETQ